MSQKSSVAQGAQIVSRALMSDTYTIENIKTGEIHKVGVSGQPLNKNGTSPRAARQANTLNKPTGSKDWVAKVQELGIPGRREGLSRERALRDKLRDEGQGLKGNKERDKSRGQSGNGSDD